MKYFIKQKDSISTLSLVIIALGLGIASFSFGFLLNNVEYITDTEYIDVPSIITEYQNITTIQNNTIIETTEAPHIGFQFNISEDFELDDTVLEYGDPYLLTNTTFNGTYLQETMFAFTLNETTYIDSITFYTTNVGSCDLYFYAKTYYDNSGEYEWGYQQINIETVNGINTISIQEFFTPRHGYRQNYTYFLFLHGIEIGARTLNQGEIGHLPHPTFHYPSGYCNWIPAINITVKPFSFDEESYSEDSFTLNTIRFYFKTIDNSSHYIFQLGKFPTDIVTGSYNSIYDGYLFNYEGNSYNTSFYVNQTLELFRIDFVDEVDSMLDKKIFINSLARFEVNSTYKIDLNKLLYNGIIYQFKMAINSVAFNPIDM